MIATGWFGPESCLLIVLCLVVTTIIYGYSELLVLLPLGRLSPSRWLKSPPTVITVSSGKGAANFFRVVASGCCSCLNTGCGLFNPPDPSPPPPALMKRLTRAEGRLEALKRHQYSLLQVRVSVRVRVKAARQAP